MSPYRSSRQRRAGPQRRAGAYALYRITNLKRNRRPGIVRAPLSARLVPTPTQACYACGKAAPETGSQLSVCHTCYIVHMHVRALYRCAQLYACSRGFPHALQGWCLVARSPRWHVAGVWLWGSRIHCSLLCMRRQRNLVETQWNQPSA